MKVLHIINSLNFGGAEKLLFDTIPKFRDRGLDVDLMVLYGKETFFLKELETKHNIKIIKRKKKSSLYHTNNIFWIRKHIKNYNIIHVHLFPCLYWVAIASFFTKKSFKLLFTEHNTNNRRRNTVLLKYIDHLIYSRYDKIIAISKGVKESLEKHLSSKKNNIIQINNGVDTLFFKDALPYTNAQLNIQKEAKIIIQVSSFYPQKDQETLVRAMVSLPRNTHLLLVGQGPLLNEKKKLVADLNLSDRIHFLGYRTDINRLLKTAHICVLSSYYEGFGLAIVEGMASGIPCVGTNVKGLAEVLKDAGIVFEVKNDFQLKNILEKLLLDNNYYTKVAKRCESKAKQYDLSYMVSSQMTLYKELYQSI